MQSRYPSLSTQENRIERSPDFRGVINRETGLRGLFEKGNHNVIALRVPQQFRDFHTSGEIDWRARYDSRASTSA